eukprot:403371988
MNQLLLKKNAIAMINNQMRHFGYRPKQETFDKWNIVRDDFVEVISGKYKKTQGKILEVDRKNNTVIVQGVNLKYKTVKDDEYVERRKTVQQEKPIHVSNVSLIDPETGTPTRVRYGFLEDGAKVRIAKKSGALIPKPDRSNLTYINRTKGKETGLNDTKPEDTLERTYAGEDFLRVKAEFDEYIRMKEEKEGLMVFKEKNPYVINQSAAARS